MIVYASVTLVGMRAKIQATVAGQQNLKAQIAQLQTSNADLQYKIDHTDDKNTFADVARNDLNLVAPGEKVFYNTGK